MDLSEKRAKIINTVFFILTAAVLVLILRYCPYVSDDFYFKSLQNNSVTDIIKSALGYGNGRFFGTSLADIFVKSNVIKTFGQVTGIMLLCIFVYKVVRFKKNQSIIPVIMLLFFVPAEIFRETYIWTSAFCNYIPGILCALVALLILKYKKGFFWNIAVFFVGMCGQLFVEHTSAVTLFLAVVMLISFKVFKEPKEKVISVAVWLAGVVIGTVIMVLIPIFFEGLEWVKVYRENSMWINMSGFDKVRSSIYCNAVNLAKIFFENYFLHIIVATVVIKLIKPGKLISAFFAAIPVYSYIVNVTNSVNGDEWSFPGLLYLDVFFLYVGLFAYLLLKNKDLAGRSTSIVFFVMCVISAGPFLIMKKPGGRVLLNSYIFFVICVLTLVYQNAENLGKVLIRLGNAVSAVLTFTLLLYLVFMFKSYNQVAYERTLFIEKQMEKKATVIEVPVYDFGYNFEEVAWGFSQYYYYEKPRDIKFIQMDYNDWVFKYKSKKKNNAVLTETHGDAHNTEDGTHTQNKNSNPKNNGRVNSIADSIAEEKN